MKRRGFTLIELLVVIVIIGILVAIALPNFIKIKDKAKEAEVKQNLHAIQLAVERYATDRDGNYPFYLYGGDSLFNVGTQEYFWIQDEGNTRVGGVRYGSTELPFDMFFIDTETWDYYGSPNVTPSWGMMISAPDQLESAFGDTLSFEGYIPKYPKNPFAQGHNSKKFSLDAFGTNYTSWGALGGRDGTLMINIGWWGELPELMLFWSGNNAGQGTTDMTIQNQVPGNFFYHPRYSDGVTNYGHNVYQLDYHTTADLPPASWNVLPPLDDSADVHSIDVAGYDLFATGSQRTKGQDVDTVLAPPDCYDDHTFRTGYATLAQERNPWIEDGGDYDNVGDYDERPYSDGFPDFYIIHLGAGMDKKIAGNVLD